MTRSIWLLLLVACDGFVDLKDTADTEETTEADADADADADSDTDTDVDTVGFDTFDCDNTSSPPICPTNDCYEAAEGPDNNSYDHATPLGSGDTVQGVHCGTGDWDIFKVGAPVGCILDVSAWFDHERGDIDTYISTRFALSSSSDFYAQWQITDDFVIGDSIDDNEHTSWVSRTVEPHYIRLVDKSGLDNDYGLTAEISCPPMSCPEDDVNEALGTGGMGDNDSQPRATKIVANDTVIGISCGDEDWYSLTTSDFGGTCVPVAILDFDPSAGFSLTLKEGASTPTSATIDATSPGRIEVHWGANNVIGAADFGVVGPNGEAYSLWATCEHLPR